MSFKKFFYDLAQQFMGDLLKLFIVFLLGTAASAVACLYYGIPLIFSLVGGLLALAVAVVLLMNL